MRCILKCINAIKVWFFWPFWRNARTISIAIKYYTESHAILATYFSHDCLLIAARSVRSRNYLLTKGRMDRLMCAANFYMYRSNSNSFWIRGRIEFDEGSFPLTRWYDIYRNKYHVHYSIVHGLHTANIQLLSSPFHLKPQFIKIRMFHFTRDLMITNCYFKSISTTSIACRVMTSIGRSNKSCIHKIYMY